MRGKVRGVVEKRSDEVKENAANTLPNPNPKLQQEVKAAEGSLDYVEKYERYVPLFLLALAAFTRLYRLDSPSGVVFDEFHFGRFTNQYMAGTYMFDIHPPLGKLTLMAAAKLVGYSGTTCSYANIQDAYPPDCKYIALRLTAAIFGILTAPVLYYVSRGFGCGVRGGILTAIMFIFDGLNLGESRLILIDSQLIFWCATCLWIAQAWWRRWASHWEAVFDFETIAGQAYTLSDALGWGGPSSLPLPPSSAEARPAPPDLHAIQRTAYAQATSRLKRDARFMPFSTRALWCLLLGWVCANCVSIKYTGLATPGMVAVESFFAFFFLRRAIPLPDLLMVAATVFLTFSSYFAIHFHVLPNSGDGDGFMPFQFQQTLVGNANYDPNVEWPGFWYMLFETNREMIDASARIEQRHHWDSKWYEWPINARGILYYSKETGHTYSSSIYLLGNPLVIWQVLVFLILSLTALAFYGRYRTDALFHWHRVPAVRVFFPAVIYCLIVYVLNLMPYVAVKRSCFIYHYMPALMYGEILSGIVMDQLTPRQFKGVVLQGLALLMVIGYLIFAPWIYNFPLTPEGHARRRWLPRWD